MTKLSRIDFGLFLFYWFSIMARCLKVSETSIPILSHHFLIGISLTPAVHPFLQPLSFTSLHSIILQTAATSRRCLTSVRTAQ